MKGGKFYCSDLTEVKDVEGLRGETWIWSQGKVKIKLRLE